MAGGLGGGGLAVLVSGAGAGEVGTPVGGVGVTGGNAEAATLAAALMAAISALARPGRSRL